MRREQPMFLGSCLELRKTFYAVSLSGAFQLFVGGGCPDRT